MSGLGELETMRDECFAAGGYLIVTRNGVHCVPDDDRGQWRDLQVAMARHDFTPAHLLDYIEAVTGEESAKRAATQYVGDGGGDE